MKRLETVQYKTRPAGKLNPMNLKNSGMTEGSSAAGWMRRPVGSRVGSGSV
jgi:hypothetical protein